ncbi:hypothetical protein JOQ06_023818 [Pogonophryne albipinna]|uniref:GOLD domain-containing protein n=1 Tax=Pogonophryne albipinna TaxID=1090488 RepID=A0AAD6BL24_9TELE|nr:hypothetical protein JOQ06_023818 [Pogonophryne albipinna]
MAAVKLLTVVLLNFFFTSVSSLYFHMGDTERKCFMEKIPVETMLMGNYRTQLYDKQREEYLPATQGLGMFVEVKDPDDKVILSRQYGSEGRFTFTSHTPGEHQICLHSNSSKFALFAGGMLAVHLDLRAAQRTNNYAEIAAREKLTDMQLRVRQLIEQVFSGWKGNLCERSLASCASLFILFPCTALAVYFLLLQTFVLRLEFILGAVLLLFYALEFLLGLLSLSSFSR